MRWISHRKRKLSSHHGFNVMPFGLTNTPAIFLQLMECVPAGLSLAQCLIYLDDIIVYNTLFKDHLKKVLTKLGEAGLELKPTKCHFAQQQVQYFGRWHCTGPILCRGSNILSSADGYEEAAGIPGPSHYYRHVVQAFASIVQPLYQLTSKNAKDFVWTPQCQQALISSNSCG